MTRKATLTARSVPSPPFAGASAVRAGNWVFLSGIMATDWRTGITPTCNVIPDFPFSEYESQLQTAEIFKQIEALLESAGSSLDELVRVDQFLPNWDDFRHYIPVRNRYLTHDRPASTAIAVNSLLVPAAKVIIDGIAVTSDGGQIKEAINNPSAPTPRAGYSLATRYGEWIWCSGASPTDFESRAAYPGGPGHAQPDGIWVDPNFWYGSAIENQATYDLKKLSLYLEQADSDLQHVVKAQVYLTDSRDLAGLMQVWNTTWGDRPPATTVVPVDRMGIGGSRCEINAIAVTRSGEIEPIPIHTDDAPTLPFNLPHAIKAGPYLFLSGQLAASEAGIDPRVRRDNRASPHLVVRGRDEMGVILDHVEAICSSAGGSITDVARAQLFCTDLNDVGAALDPWNRTFHDDPPAVSAIGISGPQIFPSLGIAGDFIAYLP